jgi:hypothetical protein
VRLHDGYPLLPRAAETAAYMASAKIAAKNRIAITVIAVSMWSAQVMQRQSDKADQRCSAVANA